MKTTYPIIVIALLMFQSSFGRSKTKTLEKDTSNFYLHYSFSGMGANLGTFQPTIRIENANLVYTLEQNSYWEEKSPRKDTICIVEFRQSSIDSIKALVKDLSDTTIYKSHLGILSGGIHFLSITIGTRTTRFEMKNTFDYTALKIAHIINQYLPKDQQLWVDEKMILDAEEYNKSLFKKKPDSKGKR